ncbi:response regulator [Breoghania sp.]|uniref:response regulator n=1 Tax=Breoghania sp. TaxID=2065378 RepID=UPI00261565F6|nr:response regulator [Breoghania sp.]MDJ0931775.1 response regulator [Breoghania sp.]
MPHSPGHAPSVLVIAESRSFSALLEQMLHGIGVGATTTIDEADAAHLWLRKNAVDAVLVDSDLPKAAALKLPHQIQCDATQHSRCVPLILMSTKSEPAMMRQAMNAGSDSVMPKLVHRVHLRGELKRLLERPRVYIRLPSGYCGPDRRRRVMSDYDGEDRRDGDNFQLFTEEGPVSREALETLHHTSSQDADIDVLLVRGAQIIAGYRLDSRAGVRHALA